MTGFKTIDELTEAERLYLQNHHTAGEDPLAVFKTFGVMYDKHGALVKAWGKDYTDAKEKSVRAGYDAAVAQMNALKTLYVRDAHLIPLKEWARAHGIDPATARQRAGRGSFETAVKVGRDWFISKDEPLVDHRHKG